MDSNDDDRVLLTTFANGVEATAARDVLDRADIDAFVSDEPSATEQPLLGPAGGAVELWIHESEADDAVDALENAPEEALDVKNPIDEMEESDRLPATIPTCPECGGQDIGLDTPFYVFLGVLVLSIPLPYVTPLDTVGGCIVTTVIFLIGQVLFVVRGFPLRCKECGEKGKRDHFKDNLPREEA
jgi:hypothetical protein